MPEPARCLEAMKMYASAIEAKETAKRLWKEFKDYAERIEEEG